MIAPYICIFYAYTYFPMISLSTVLYHIISSYQNRERYLLFKDHFVSGTLTRNHRQGMRYMKKKHNQIIKILYGLCHMVNNHNIAISLGCIFCPLDHRTLHFTDDKIPYSLFLHCQRKISWKVAYFLLSKPCLDMTNICRDILMLISSTDWYSKS